MSSASKQLAGLIGPALLAISLTEAFNIDIFTAQTSPVVYLNGTILFVAGLAIVRAHNHWRLGWTVLVTLIGWAALALGLFRMVFPTWPQAGGSFPTYLLLAVLFVIGAIMTIAGYLPRRQNELAKAAD